MWGSWRGEREIDLDRICLRFPQTIFLLSGFFSGLGHNRCWFGLAPVLCRHLPTSQSSRVWHSLRWLAVPSRAESSPGTAGVAGALALGGGEHTRALPTQRLATLSNTVPSLKYLGLVGLSLQLKLKHEGSPSCFSLCVAFERGPCQKHVMETVEGGCSGICACQGAISSSFASCSLLPLSAPERQVFVCQQKVTFGMVVKVIFHMFTDMPVTKPRALTYLWQGLTK